MCFKKQKSKKQKSCEKITAVMTVKEKSKKVFAEERKKTVLFFRLCRMCFKKEIFNSNCDDRKKNLILKVYIFKKKGKKVWAFLYNYYKKKNKKTTGEIYLTVAGAGGGVAPGRLVPAELSIALRGRGVRQTGRHREQEVVRERLVRLHGTRKGHSVKRQG
jgi:hypothetical protein